MVLLAVLGFAVAALGVFLILKMQSREADAREGKPDKAGYWVLGGGALIVLSAIALGGTPPTPTTSTLGAGAPAKQDASRPAAAISKRPTLPITEAQLLEKLNEDWREANISGAFAVRNSDVVEAGTNKGGKITSACASSRICVLIESEPAGGMISAVMMTSADERSDSGLEAVFAHTSMVTAIEPEGSGLLDRLDQGMKNLVKGEENRTEPHGDVCLLVTGGRAIGFWTVVTPPPCKNDD